jgi:tetratricopeptide (TPR) repeat protein
MYSAMEAVEKSEFAKAKQLLREFEEKFARERQSSTEYERLTVLSAVGRIYAQIEDVDMAINYYQEACASAEKIAPNAEATGGDYLSLAELLSSQGRSKEAIVVAEAAKRHLKGSGKWKNYKENYEQFLAGLKKGDRASFFL